MTVAGKLNQPNNMVKGDGTVMITAKTDYNTSQLALPEPEVKIIKPGTRASKEDFISNNKTAILVAVVALIAIAAVWYYVD
jgi:hypothetical protein